MKKYLLILGIAFPGFVFAQDKTATTSYLPKFDFSLISGSQDFKKWGVNGFVYGIGISFQCPLVEGGDSKIRQQFNISRQENKMFRSLIAEMSPQFNIINKGSFEIGISPGAGFIFINTGGEKKKIFTYGLGAVARYSLKKFFISIENHYSLTKKKSFSALHKDDELPVVANLNNWQTSFRIGYKLHK